MLFLHSCVSAGKSLMNTNHRSLTFFTPFSRPREKCKWLCFKLLTIDFHRFFTIFEKTFRVSLVPCPAVVPGLSHALSGTRKLLKKGHLALFFCSVPRILQTKIIFGGDLRVDNAQFVA